MLKVVTGVSWVSGTKTPILMIPAVMLQGQIITGINQSIYQLINLSTFQYHFLGKNPVCVFPKLECSDEQLLQIVDFAFQSTKLVISQKFQVDIERIQLLEVLNDVIKTVSLTKFFGNFFGFLSQLKQCLAQTVSSNS